MRKVRRLKALGERSTRARLLQFGHHHACRLCAIPAKFSQELSRRDRQWRLLDCGYGRPSISGCLRASCGGQHRSRRKGNWGGDGAAIREAGVRAHFAISYGWSGETGVTSAGDGAAEFSPRRPRLSYFRRFGGDGNRDKVGAAVFLGARRRCAPSHFVATAELSRKHLGGYDSQRKCGAPRAVRPDACRVGACGALFLLPLPVWKSISRLRDRLR